MSLLTDAEQTYKDQRAAVRSVGTGALQRTYRRVKRRAQDGDQLALVRLAALRHEFARRGIEVTNGRC